MLPIALLIREHRLIERMVELMGEELERLQDGGEPDTEFIEDAARFIRVYADALHHGKEEDALFRDLSDRDISSEHREIMEQLVEDHEFSRRTTKALLQANAGYAGGDNDAAEDIADELRKLVNLYPDHIHTEDMEFFRPSMEYLTEEEQQGMLEEFQEFDRRFIHEHYEGVVEQMGQERSR